MDDCIIQQTIQAIPGGWGQCNSQSTVLYSKYPVFNENMQIQRNKKIWSIHRWKKRT